MILESAVYELTVMQGLTEQQRMIFMQQMVSHKKDATVAVLLALFLGGLGAHRFYMGEIGLGLLYFVFSWTFVPSFVALIECFLMKDRVQRYNDVKAAEIAHNIRIAFPQ